MSTSFGSLLVGRLVASIAPISCRLLFGMAGNAGTYTINASGNHSGTVIFLHGLGDTGEGWSEGFKELRLPHLKIICPTASVQPVTLNMGMPMPSWFDIYGLSADSKQDTAGLKRSATLLRDLIEAEVNGGIKHDRIVVGGFSQGGAVCMHSMLTKQYGDIPPLAGMLLLSTWLPMHTTFPQDFNPNQRKTPILQCHGASDPLVPYAWGVASSTALNACMETHELKTYQGLGHSSSPEEMRDVKTFLQKVLPPQ